MQSRGSSEGALELDSSRINFSWLIRVRWAVIAAQIGVMVVVQQGMGAKLPLTGLSSIVAASLALNVASLFWVRRARAVRDVHLALAACLDLVLFTAILYATGGPANPFSSLYLVYVALAAVILPPRWSWALVSFALACSAALFVYHVPLSGADHHAHHGGAGFMDWHLRGMWVSLGVTASFIVYFLHRVMQALRGRDQELTRERERTLRHERAAAVATLAAGAAHELSTPLGTIGLVSSELERALRKQGAPSGVTDDVALIQSEVVRCRKILDQLSVESGQVSGGPLAPLDPRELLELSLEGLPDRERVKVGAMDPAAELYGPRHALAQAVRSLLANALEASHADQPVEVTVSFQGGFGKISVRDQGTGMPPEVLERAREPFFSTKRSGLGLGLFLVQGVADQLGGALTIESVPGGGTRTVLSLPVESPRQGVMGGG